ncbi:hypothetical protein [Pseudomonas sp. B1(2018)]|uniref:hypothetical protein n=1 Tax=Pseudomonas sp. B1(2018) TaxID=2233856 RepID=UPI001058268E|nr:hypothetical protein [Pseudomonas sp. B1(2018)]
MPIKVGDTTVVLSEVLFVPENEIVSFEVDAGEEGGRLPVKILITNDVTNSIEDEKADPIFVIEYETSKTTTPAVGDDIICAVMKFHNFNKTYGQTIQVPQVVAVVGGTRQITFLASVYKFGKITKIELQFMMGAIK